MGTLHIEPLDVDDLARTEDIVRLYAAADAVDRPWHPGYSTALVHAMAVNGWDDQPEQFVLGYDPHGDLVAAGSVELPARDNRHSALVEARVLPHRRRQGYGTAMYDHLQRVAAYAGRTHVFTGGPDSEAGRRFAEQRGYAVASVGMTRQVKLGETSDRLVRAVLDEVAAHTKDYELLRMSGPVPDDLLDVYLDAVAAINDAPLDDLEVEDEVYDADRIRHFEQGQWLAGHRLYRILARHRDTGQIAGHTVVAVEADRPYLGEQYDTTVVAAHRGHRLGLLLKADMMRWLREVEPALRTVTTHNAASNDHMIAVNERLGYRVLGRSLEYQRDLVPADLAASSPHAGSVTGTA